MSSSQPRGRWVAILTGTISVLIGILYLALITFLDARGPMLPPPPEALAEVGVLSVSHSEEVEPLFVRQFR